MSIFTIKLIAVITMLLDHIRYAIPETNCILFELLGRMSYPLFAFVLTEGYIHTSSKKEYAKRLIKYGLISQIPFMLFRSILGKNEWKMLNIMFTLLLGFIGILSLDKIKNKLISIPILILLIFQITDLKKDKDLIAMEEEIEELKRQNEKLMKK